MVACKWRCSAPAPSAIGFDPEFPVTFEDAARLRTSSAVRLLNLHHCDAAISTTDWQRSRQPSEYRQKIVVAHEGVDTEHLNPDTQARFTAPIGTVVNAGDLVLTYVARNLEPYRGFHTFMRALPQIQRSYPNLQTLIVGGDDISYGARSADARNWRERMLQEVGTQLDAARTHFLGKLPQDAYRRVLQVSAVHAYPTYPYVIGWSALEAMATGCLVVGSNTPPVKEAIGHGRNGLLFRALFHQSG